jgi:hypothetical protein
MMEMVFVTATFTTEQIHTVSRTPRTWPPTRSQLWRSLLGVKVLSQPVKSCSLLKCTQTCGKNGGCAPSLDSSDPSSASCLSTARVCTWTWSDYGPFQAGCANLPDKNAVLPRFGVDPCVGSDDMSRSVPWSYLGGGIVDNDAPGWWNGQSVCHNHY